MTNNTPTPFDWRSELPEFIKNYADVDKKNPNYINFITVKDLKDWSQKVEAATEERVRGEIIDFSDEELKVMLLDYQSLISISKRFPRTVEGDNKVEFELNYSDSVRENILKKLELLGEKGE